MERKQISKLYYVNMKIEKIGLRLIPWYWKLFRNKFILINDYYVYYY